MQQMHTVKSNSESILLKARQIAQRIGITGIFLHPIALTREEEKKRRRIIVYYYLIRSHIQCHFVHINYLIIDRTIRLAINGTTKRTIIYR